MTLPYSTGTTAHTGVTILTFPLCNQAQSRRWDVSWLAVSEVPVHSPCLLWAWGGRGIMAWCRKSAYLLAARKQRKWAGEGEQGNMCTSKDTLVTFSSWALLLTAMQLATHPQVGPFLRLVLHPDQTPLRSQSWPLMTSSQSFDAQVFGGCFLFNHSGDITMENSRL